MQLQLQVCVVDCQGNRDRTQCAALEYDSQSSLGQQRPDLEACNIAGSSLEVWNRVRQNNKHTNTH